MTELERAAVEYVAACDRVTEALNDWDRHLAREIAWNAKVRLESAVRERLSTTPDTPASFEVHVNDEWRAGTSGRRDEALAEAMRYAQMYRREGEVTVNEVTRTMVARMTATTEDAT